MKRVSAQEMRKSQCLAAQCELWKPEVKNRKAINVYEFAAGLHKTFRQWRMHNGYYLFNALTMANERVHDYGAQFS